MSGYDVHTDKALKELRARLDQAERERDEAGRAFRDLVAVLDRDGGQRQAGETVAGTLERAIRVAADAVVGADALREERDEALAALAAAKMERDVAWVRLVCDAEPTAARYMIARGLGVAASHAEALFVAIVDDVVPPTDADIAAAIRAARGAL